MKLIFVDGYNVINSWPNLRDIKNNNFDAGREELIKILQNYSGYQGCKIYLVFDAHLLPGSIEKKEKISENLYVIYTKEKETADSYIERNINNLDRKYEAYVVTSDWLEQQVIFQRGAVRISSIEFLNEVKKVENNIKSSTYKKYSDKRNSIQDVIQENKKKKLEKIRRSN